MILNISYIEVAPSSTNQIVPNYLIGKSVIFLQEIGRRNRLVSITAQRIQIDEFPKAGLNLIAPIDEREHGELEASCEPLIKGGLAVVTHIDIIPPQNDIGSELVKELCIKSRTHEGCIFYNAYFQTSRPNHMTVIENWQSIEMHHRHSENAETIDLRTKLSSIMGALYDERYYQLVS